MIAAAKRRGLRSGLETPMEEVSRFAGVAAAWSEFYRFAPAAAATLFGTCSASAFPHLSRFLASAWTHLGWCAQHPLHTGPSYHPIFPPEVAPSWCSAGANSDQKSASVVRQSPNLLRPCQPPQMWHLAGQRDCLRVRSGARPLGWQIFITQFS